MCGMWVVESICSSLIGVLLSGAVVRVMASALGTINSFWTDCLALIDRSMTVACIPAQKTAELCALHRRRDDTIFRLLTETWRFGY